MPWKTRICGEDLFHHVYAWGNDHHPVFKEAYHYQKYLRLLVDHSSANQISIIAYALMQWHVHLFIHDNENNISRFMYSLHGEYAQYYNRETHRTGHVFGERFNNKIVQANEYGLWLSRYIHRQPVEAGLVEDPGDYPWTSYRAYIGTNDTSRANTISAVAFKKEIILQHFGIGENAKSRYRDFVMGDDDGPIDWRDNKITIAIEHEILNRAMSECGLPKRVLVNPHGMTERLRRQEIILILHSMYGYKARPLARALQMSHSSVVEILKKATIKTAGAD